MKHSHIKKTILFIVVEVGIAHITRSLAIAEAVHLLGHRAIFALPKRKHSLISTTPVEIIDIPPIILRDSIKVVNALKDPKKIKILLDEELRIIKQHRPDAVVCDYRMSAVIAGALSNLPTFFIANSGGVPYSCSLPNIGVPRVLHNFVAPFLQILVWRVKMRFIKCVEQVAQEYDKKWTHQKLFERMTYIIPETEDYMVPLGKHLDNRFVGPILWKGFDHIRVPSWFRMIRKTGKTIYVTMGGTGFDKQIFIRLCELLIKRGYIVVVSCSTIAHIDDFPKYKNLFVTDYLPGFEICKIVDAVICHGGYGTMVQAVLAGAPVVAIPFNPDQILHSLRFQELGLCKVVLPIDITFFINLIVGDWEGFERVAKRTDPEKVMAALTTLLDNTDVYKKSIQRFTKGINYTTSPKKAATVILDSV